MPTTLQRSHDATRRHSRQLTLVAIVAVVNVRSFLEFRFARIRATGDRGSESVEKAVLVAICLAMAIGLAFTIRAVVQKYQGQIQ